MVALILAGCGTNPKTVTIKVVATTDVHGCIFNTDCVDASEREGSLAKFATFLARVRKENRNVVYLDAGDVLQGSIEVYQDATSQFLRSPLVSEAYNYLDCEAIAMGNHDLSAGSAVYDRFMRALGCPVLSANLYYVESGDFLLPYRIIERQGVRIAVLGLTTPVVRYSIPQDQMAEISVGDMVRTAQKWVPVLRDELKADVVIGLFHSGLEEGRMDAEGIYEDDSRRVVATVPGFDAVIYGHDHEANCTSVVNCEGDTVIMINPGPYALNAAELTVTVDRENARVDASARLVDITGEIPDRDFERHLAGWQSDVRSYADSLIGTLNCDLESNGVLWRSGTAMDYIHTIQMRFAGAEVSLTAPVPTATLIPAGDMRIRDVSKLYRYENTMVSVMLKGSEIKDILEYSSGLFYNTIGKGTEHLLRLKPDGEGTQPEYPASCFITAAGLDYTVDVTKPVGKRVTITQTMRGEKFNPDKYYRTTINSFLYGGTESYLFDATGLTRKEMMRRLNSSSSIDIRYYVIADFYINKEDHNNVNINRYNNWSLSPAGPVQGYLKEDTVRFSLIPLNN